MKVRFTIEIETNENRYAVKTRFRNLIRIAFSKSVGSPQIHQVLLSTSLVLSEVKPTVVFEGAFNEATGVFDPCNRDTPNDDE